MYKLKYKTRNCKTSRKKPLKNIRPETVKLLEKKSLKNSSMIQIFTITFKMIITEAQATK